MTAKEHSQLTPKQIVEVFQPDKKMLRSKLRYWQSKIPDVSSTVKKIDQHPCKFVRWFYKYWLALIVDQEPFRHVKRIKRDIKLLEPVKGGLDVERAKNINILDIHTFKKMRRFGGKHKAICPFHDEKTPSFIVYPDNTFYCFGCHAKGDVISFIMQREGFGFKQAVKYLGG